MGVVGIAIVIIALAVIALAILRFELVKKLAMFLAFGFIIASMVVMAGRIWDPKLSAWWVVVIEVVLVIAVLMKTRYLD